MKFKFSQEMHDVDGKPVVIMPGPDARAVTLGELAYRALFYPPKDHNTSRKDSAKRYKIGKKIKEQVDEAEISPDEVEFILDCMGVAYVPVILGMASEIFYAK